MKSKNLFGVAVMALGLAACGGGGGGTTSTPAPPSSPAPTPSPSPSPTPPATNTDISTLVVDETFPGTGSSSTSRISLPDGTVESTSAQSAKVEVLYNSNADSFTISLPSYETAFDPSHRAEDRFEGELMYRKSDGPQSEYLTLSTQPYLTFPDRNKYVGFGYLQRNLAGKESQDTEFDTFYFGFATDAGSLPRTGSAHWLTDVLGLLTPTGKELKVVQGTGDFDVDFINNVYRFHSFVSENNVVTDGGAAGALVLQSAGSLNADGTFGGILTYRGNSAALNGALQGGFFGPGAAEMAATFSANGPDGALTGVMTGRQSDRASTSAGIRMLNLIQFPARSQRLFGSAGQVYEQTNLSTGARQIGNISGWDGSADYDASGLQGVNFPKFGYTLNADDLASSAPAGFTAYEASIGGVATRIELFDVGVANPVLELTYLSFGFATQTTISSTPSGQQLEDRTVQMLLYGVQTPRDLLTVRSGTAQYDGRVFGHAVRQGGGSYDIGGTAQFRIDFAAEVYDGYLDMTGTSASEPYITFGRVTFDSRIADGLLLQAWLVGPEGSDPGSLMQPFFFGPTGEEIGATFDYGFGESGAPGRIDMIGAVVAKEQ